MDYKSNNSYFKKLILPILWEFIFIYSCFMLPQYFYIYTNFIFYLGIIIYFHFIGDFSFKKIIENFKCGKKFWFPVLWTSLSMIGAFLLTILIASLFPNLDDGMFNLQTDNWTKLFLFAVSTIIFPPLAEETLYRQAFIRFDNKLILVISSLFGMLLYSLEHTVTPFGIIQVMIIALPLTISYIKTKNVYVTITSHFIVNLIGNGLTVIFTAIYLLNK